MVVRVKISSNTFTQAHVALESKGLIPQSGCLEPRGIRRKFILAQGSGAVCPSSAVVTSSWG
eukprot:1025854-Amphidinium_carterae.1